MTAQRQNTAKLIETIHVDVQFNQAISLSKNFCSCVKKTRAYIKEHNIDVLVCTSEMLAPVCAIAIIGTKTRYLVWLHANIDVVGEYRFQSLCRKIALKTASRVIVLTPEMREKYNNKFGNSNVQVIGNPIDNHLMTPVRYDAQAKKIISVGRLVYAKNYDMLIEVANIVLKEHPEWSWDIYGEGNLRERLQAKIDNSDLHKQLHLMGSVENIYDRYSDYAFLVMTSKYEGFPMVLLEGMARGLPLVAFDITTGPKYIIRNKENGLLVSEVSVEKMASAVRELIVDESERVAMSEANLRIRDAFCLDSALTAWREALQCVYNCKDNIHE